MDAVTRQALEMRDKQAQDLQRQLDEAISEAYRIERMIAMHQTETDLIRSQVYFIQFQDETIDDALSNQDVAYSSIDEAKDDAFSLGVDKGLSYKVRSMLYPFETKFEGIAK